MQTNFLVILNYIHFSFHINFLLRLRMSLSKSFPKFKYHTEMLATIICIYHR